MPDLTPVENRRLAVGHEPGSAGERISTWFSPKAVIALGALVVVLMVAISANQMTKGKGVAEALWTDDLDHLSRLLAEQTFHALTAADTVLRSVAEQPADTEAAADRDLGRQFSGAEAFRSIADRIKGVPQIDVLSILDMNGDVVNFTRAFPAPAISHSDSDFFKAHLDDPGLALFLSKPTRSKVTGTWTIYLSRKIRDRRGQMTGVAVVGIATPFFAQIYDTARKDPEQAIVLLRRDGSIIARAPAHEKAVGGVLPSGSRILERLSDGRGLASGWSEAPRTVDAQDHTRRLVVVRAVPGFPMVVGSSVPETVVFRLWSARVKVLGASVLVISTLIMGLCIGIAHFMRRQAAALAALAETEHERMKQALELQLRDERETRLAQEVSAAQRKNALDEDLRSSIDSLGRMIESARRLSERMAAVAHGAKTGSTEVEETSRRTSEFIRIVAANAETISKVGFDIADRAITSFHTADAVIEDADKTDAAVDMLRKATEHVNKVSGLIRQVAGHTNLLALNATIEAARAGESGRGFAVVASEIKNLASQTASATDEIDREIDAIYKAGALCIEALQSIRGRMLETRVMGRDVTDRVRQQSQSTEEIARTVRSAADGAAEVLQAATAVREVADASEESAGEVVAFSREIEQEIRRIQQTLERAQQLVPTSRASVA